MKINLYIAGTALMLSVVAGGCANSRDLIANTSFAAKNDVVTETANPKAQSGKAVMDVKLALKSNSWRFAEIYGKHGNPPYRVQLNIDGQTTTLEAEPVLEDRSSFPARVPESGTGWKYRFSKQIVLAPGKHKLTIALPVDDVIVEREVELREGLNTIELTPVYSKRALRPYKGGQTFTAGVRTLDVKIN